MNEPELNEGVSVTELCAMWGCDPCYDLPPRKKGDGYLFYNYAIEGDDPKFLQKFIPAVKRTIKSCVERNDKEDLEAVLVYLNKKLKGMKCDNGQKIL